MARTEREKPETKPKIGEMPKPRFFEVRNGKEKTNWIGIEAYSPEKQLKKFLWWTNSTTGDLNEKKARLKTAAVVARFELQGGIEIAVGPAIDLYKFETQTGLVKTIDDSGMIGLYVEADKRSVFNPSLIGKAKTTSLGEFVDLLFKAEAVLPRPKVEIGDKNSQK